MKHHEFAGCSEPLADWQPKFDYTNNKKFATIAEYFRKYSFIEGLFLMGSRAEGDHYQRVDFSDIDCCVIVSQAIDYLTLYDIVRVIFPKNIRLELCPRTVSQLNTKNKFNFDLKYLSKAIYFQDFDIRLTIPEINVSDFPQKNVDNILLSSLEFFMSGLYKYFKDELDIQQVMIYLEKSVRKLALYLNLCYGLYPLYDIIAKTNLLVSLYKSHGKRVAQLTLFRKYMEFEHLDVMSLISSLTFILNRELLALAKSCSNPIDLLLLSEKLTDSEHHTFTCSLLNIFFDLSKNGFSVESSTKFRINSEAKNIFVQQYSSLVDSEDNKFCPPQIIDGGYHVFK